MARKGIESIETFGVLDMPYSPETYLVLPHLYSDIAGMELCNVTFEGKIDYRLAFRKWSLIQEYNNEKILYVILSGKLKTVCISPQYQSIYQPPVYRAIKSQSMISIMYDFAYREKSGWTLIEPPYIPNYHGFSFLNSILEYASSNYLKKVTLKASANHRVTSNGKKDVLIEGRIIYKTERNGNISIPYKISMLDWQHSFTEREDVCIKSSSIEEIIGKL